MLKTIAYKGTCPGPTAITNTLLSHTWILRRCLQHEFMVLIILSSSPFVLGIISGRNDFFQNLALLYFIRELDLHPSDGFHAYQIKQNKKTKTWSKSRI